jgi:hypothetical protein
VSAALSRLPAMATTGVGSLPFTRVGPAADHAVDAYELPFCPQLPRLEGDMIGEWLGADPTGCGWSPDRDRQLPAAWDAFALALADRPPPHRVVKLQVTGPVTLAVALERAAGRAGRGAEMVDLAQQIALWVATAAADRAGWLEGELGLDTLVIADEPGLAHAALSPGHAGIWDPLRHAATAWGLHVCCAVPWAVVSAAAPDLLSFDLTRSPVGPEGARALEAIVCRGGRVMWGALDAGAAPDLPAAGERIAAAWSALPGVAGTQLAAGSLVSASCGTGGLAPSAERATARALHELAAGGRSGGQLPGIGGDVDGVLAQDLERNHLERALVGGGEHDERGSAVVMGAQPVGGGHTPAIAGHEAGEVEHRDR